MQDQPVTWIAVILGLISTISGITMAIVSRYTARDKLQYDAKLLVLEQGAKKCEEDHQECKEETAALHKRIDELHGVGSV